ncbi:MAG TPA: universal stress protein [candidate division Zixibacteria bacterium]|nr:universal stress protein [candidate division Zixibacteria bacterium]
MRRAPTYLVPIDFSPNSEKALDYALSMARERGAKVVVLHVVQGELVYPPMGGTFDFYGLLERDARESFRRLAARKRLAPDDCRFVLVRGTDFARVIAEQARKLRAELIIMGSHGRTGLQRLMLGSVAERTLRYARCPVLVVKR